MSKTGVVWEPIYVEHVMSAFHPESPDRLIKIKEKLDKTDAGKRSVRLPARAASEDEIAYVHDKDYIEIIKMTGGKTVQLDADTTACPKSYQAALMAAGGVISAVDAVYNGTVDNAFAFVRPPGHHAERGHAMGFCIFNNVAIAAEHAIKKHGAKRVVIVDFDIHHGNGTQNSFYNRSDVFYISTHRSPFYPGTGLEFETGAGLGKGYTLNVPLEVGDDTEFREVYSLKIIPAIKKYNPDLILVSAGYDAHADDPLGGYYLSTDTYNKVTAELKKTAEECCGGKIVFVLEGGYNTSALSECAEGALKMLED